MNWISVLPHVSNKTVKFSMFSIVLYFHRKETQLFAVCELVFH